MKRIRYISLVVSGILIVLLCSCVDEKGSEPEYYSYFESLPIDTILMGDTLNLDDTVWIAYQYPAGCNSLDAVEYTRSGDTILFDVVYHFYFFGQPCAHGPGYDTVTYIMDLTQPGDYLAVYRNADDSLVVIPFYYHRL